MLKEILEVILSIQQTTGLEIDIFRPRAKVITRTEKTFTNLT